MILQFLCLSIGSHLLLIHESITKNKRKEEKKYCWRKREKKKQEYKEKYKKKISFLISILLRSLKYSI